MKLSEIDHMHALKALYITKVTNLRNAKQNRVSEVKFYNFSATLTDNCLELVRSVIVEHLQDEVDELHTKLTMVGITDFEGWGAWPSGPSAPPSSPP